MKPLLITIAFLMLTTAASAQIHVAANVGVTGNLGFANPQLGANVGISHRKNRIGFSGDFSVDRIKKNVGGSGYQATGRETLRIFKDRFFVQGGAQESHYKVRDYGKSAFAPLIGVGYAAKASTFEATFLADVTSPNLARIAEARWTFMLKRHIWLRFVGAVDNFVQGRKRMTGGATRFEAGWYK